MGAPNTGCGTGFGAADLRTPDPEPTSASSARTDSMNPSPDPPARPQLHASIAQRLARLSVRAYRLTLSGLVGSNCRHLPTCSQFADEAFARHGFWAGGWMTLARLMRCNPFGTSGLDFVPGAPPPGACWYMPWRYGRWRGTNTLPPLP
jgi:uncharacterized protein